MSTRKECFDAIDDLEQVVYERGGGAEWSGTKAKAIRDYIFSLEEYIKQVEEDYDEIDSKSRR
jgi:hypothetical protein